MRAGAHGPVRLPALLRRDIAMRIITVLVALAVAFDKDFDFLLIVL